jgi:2,4-dienoyl-CoA reductase-like NADH-dependent reductase (Old Yellow Enzyme family)
MATFQNLPVPDDVKHFFSPVKIGRYELAHRIVMAPVTRCRAFGNLAQPAAAVYYGQRATEGGLLITEGTCISPEGHGCGKMPSTATPLDRSQCWLARAQSVLHRTCAPVKLPWRSP